MNPMQPIIEKVFKQILLAIWEKSDTTWPKFVFGQLVRFQDKIGIINFVHQHLNGVQYSVYFLDSDLKLKMELLDQKQLKKY